MWFIGFLGIDERISISKLPTKFSHEAWEALDLMLSDEPEPCLGLDIDERNRFFRFELEIDSGFDSPHEDEWGFVIKDFKEISVAEAL